MASLKRPKRLLLLIPLALIFGLVIVGQNRADSPLGSESFRAVYPLFLTMFVVASVYAAVSNGIMSFTPAEVHFYFPAPLGTRALLAIHVLGSGVKSLTGAVVFACFVRPGGISFLRATAAYMLLFLILTMLGLALDLAHIELPEVTRKRRGRRLVLVTLLLAVGAVGATAWAEGGWSLAVLEPLALPAWPVTQLLFADTRGVLAGLAVAAGLVVVCAVPAATYKGNVREAAGRASERMAQMLERMQKGTMLLEKPGRSTGGRLLPMLPRWGGAGVHVWRQLTALLRLRKSYVMLLIMTVVVGLTPIAVSKGAVNPEAVAGALLGMLAFAGPSYVQCDFRADYDSLAYLRSLPSYPTALATGQLLASTFVLWVLQLVTSAWIVVVAPASHRLAWLGVLVLLPLLNLIQVAVENGVFLLFPVRIGGSKGPPGALAMGRLYAVLLLKMVVVFSLLGLAAGVGFGVGLLANPAVGVLAGAVVVLFEAAACVWLVGRLFLRVDVSRDLDQ